MKTINYKSQSAEAVNSAVAKKFTEVDVERVVNTIKSYLVNYTPSYLDKFGDCCICVEWDNFNEDDMRMLIEDGLFALSVRDTLYKKGTIVELSGFHVDDDGVYVTVDYDKMFNKVEVDEDNVYGIVEQLCTDMQEKMIECGNFMIGYKYAEPDYQGRPAEWFEDMIFVTKKSDLDEDGDYVWDDCEVFRIGDYFTYLVELMRGDIDVIAEIKDAIVEYMD